MNITESELSAQYQRAKSKWPFIHQTELASGLPRMLLFAVGSRETNLTNEVGDSGHGHGVWQLDDRSHMPPGGFAQFDGNVPLQCSMAADMLHDLLAREAGNVERAANATTPGSRKRRGRPAMTTDPTSWSGCRPCGGSSSTTTVKGPCRPGLPGIWASRRPSCKAATWAWSRRRPAPTLTACLGRSPGNTW